MHNTLVGHDQLKPEQQELDRPRSEVAKLEAT